MARFSSAMSRAAEHARAPTNFFRYLLVGMLMLLMFSVFHQHSRSNVPTGMSTTTTPLNRGSSTEKVEACSSTEKVEACSRQATADGHCNPNRSDKLCMAARVKCLLEAFPFRRHKEKENNGDSLIIAPIKDVWCGTPLDRFPGTENELPSMIHEADCIVL
jgi:hypothetical protein